ncbi:hypothetical protein GEU84_007635 [Fertoebacter nigrum]|uniref:Uncharacterized protein n=1 Tax=Fertoeibacter niger TaxID=2656921 RepID=A0A8X8H106_9RHOB|nr:hypothetical protein [Fertoeibacter niger]
MNIEVLRGECANVKRAGLRQIWTCPSGWEAILIDDATGVCWRLDYPESEYHAGGSPRLTRMELEANPNGPDGLGE